MTYSYRLSAKNIEHAVRSQTFIKIWDVADDELKMELITLINDFDDIGLRALLRSSDPRTSETVRALRLKARILGISYVSELTKTQLLKAIRSKNDSTKND